jgi:hypothetical protein
MLAGPISASLRVPPERPFRPASRIGDSTSSRVNDVSFRERPGEVKAPVGFLAANLAVPTRPT